MTVRDRLAEYEGFVDVGVLHHGFAPHMRDYDIIFEALWGAEKPGDRKGTYRLRFTHCPEVVVTSAVSDEAWKESWRDVFINYAEWEAGGGPAGFVWGVCWSCAYPGLSYVEDSVRAPAWSKRLERPMHEVSIATEAFDISVVFHDFSVTKLNDTVAVIDKVILPFDPKG